MTWGTVQTSARRIIVPIGVALLVGSTLAFNGAAQRTLDIYFIDVEGGQSTLIVTPSGQSLLVDTGYADFDSRDPKRIVAAAEDADITQIDYVLLTHFHPDHDGGVVELARRIPIRTFIDHGDVDRTPSAVAVPQWPQILELYQAYLPVRAAAQHLQPVPGDLLPLGGVNVTFVSSAGATISEPLPGAGQPNAMCDASPPPPGEAFQNPRSTGIVLQFGLFRFLDLGDLSGEPLFALLCPRSLIGSVDLYVVPHHGAADASYPATFAALRPRVAIVNNGAIKGGSPEVFANIRGAPGLEAAWQLHTSELDGVVNLPESQAANVDETTAEWIKVSAEESGAFTVTNGRTNVTTAFSAWPERGEHR